MEIKLVVLVRKQLTDKFEQVEEIGGFLGDGQWSEKDIRMILEMNYEFLLGHATKKIAERFSKKLNGSKRI